MTPTLSQPWPPGTYEAAHRQARSPLNEARARAGLPAFAHYDEHEAEPGPDWPPALVQPDEPMPDDEWDRLAAKYPSPPKTTSPAQTAPQAARR